MFKLSSLTKGAQLCETLDPRISKLEAFELRDARIESRVSSFECQLTFERYRTRFNSEFSNNWLSLATKIYVAIFLFIQ